jgi:hypothetical protein
MHQSLIRISSSDQKLTNETASWSVLDVGLHQPFDSQEDVADESIRQEAEGDPAKIKM